MPQAVIASKALKKRKPFYKVKPVWIASHYVM